MEGCGKAQNPTEPNKSPPPPEEQLGTQNPNGRGRYRKKKLFKGFKIASVSPETFQLVRWAASAKHQPVLPLCPCLAYNVKTLRSRGDPISPRSSPEHSCFQGLFLTSLSLLRPNTQLLRDLKDLGWGRHGWRGGCEEAASFFAEAVATRVRGCLRTSL